MYILCHNSLLPTFKDPEEVDSSQLLHTLCYSDADMDVDVNTYAYSND